MREGSDRLAGYKLLETGSLVTFDVLDTQVETSPGGDMVSVRIDIRLGEEEEDGGRSDDHEWGALRFIFCLAVLSFHDARPRGVSGIAFAEKDELSVADFVEHLRYERSKLSSLRTLRRQMLGLDAVGRARGEPPEVGLLLDLPVVRK